MGDRPGEIHLLASGRGAGGERLNARNYRIRSEDNLGKGSLKQKFRDNVAAIRLLRQLEAQDRDATEQEKAVLVRYVGWGGMPQVFAAPAPVDWAAESNELRDLLNENEFNDARASTLNAHYTSPIVICSIYDALQRLGFQQGRILEPAAGVGHFFGLMPESMRAGSRLTGIEIDSLSARIARKLYPDVKLHNRGFEKTNLPDNSFDLAISNIPFGNYAPYDPTLPGFLIHDYFFAKALESVRTEGLIVFITSKGTLDKQNDTIRGYLSSRADLIGAIRLPNTAFKENANTEVTTDIVFLRKRALCQTPSGPPWLQLAEHRNEEGISFQINEYYAAHPEMMLGSMQYACTMYRSNEPALVPDGRELEEALGRAVSLLPSSIYAIVENSNHAAGIPSPPHVKERAYHIHEGMVTVRTDGCLIPIGEISEERRRRVRGLISIRDAVRETLRTQLEERPAGEIDAARRDLNLHYDHFVSRFGPINLSANRRAFDDDPDLPLLCSLEDYDDDTGRAAKTAIFREATIQGRKAVTSAANPRDALIYSLNEQGRVDLAFIESLLGQTPDQFLPELKGLIYRDPISGEWETEDRYLSGNVRDKLEQARAAAQADRVYDSNVRALEGVQPIDLAWQEIEARLGSAWIPASDIEQFATELLGASVQVSHSPPVGMWFVTGGRGLKTAVSNNTEWGTARRSAILLLEDALNLKLSTVYDPVPNTDQRVINLAETESARDKLQKIKERFRTWIWEDEERRERLCALYNLEFNNVRLRTFNGNHLTLPGSSAQVILRNHQKNAVWRIIQSDNTLLAHAVGAGKTYTMVAAGMELKRLGLASKPMFVVPNHMLGQFSSELLNLYPTAHILVAGKEDFEASKRARLFSRIATGNWDAVIVTHASFGRIGMSLERRKVFIEGQIEELERAIRDSHQDRGTRMVKELERAKRRLETRLQTLMSEERKDNTLTFEELGVDRLFVDEAHKFKNLFYTTKMTRVAGLSQASSERAMDMFLKVQFIQERNQGGGVVFSTGTPISNTMAEMFTMQRYLQMPTLRRHRLAHFDSWAGSFGEIVSSMEISPDGSGYRVQSRFAQFVNVPELMLFFREFADVQTAEMLKLPVPKLLNGAPVTISSPASPELRKFVGELVKRTEKIKGGQVQPYQDNMLKITGEGRKAALDMRLVKPRLRNDPESKLNKAVDCIFKIWRDSASTKGTQMVFCDLSTPKETGFSAYHDVRDKLVALGIPPEQIAFIQECPDDASKLQLFKRVRAGSVRVLLGSTLKMGEGTNVQQRLVALHHLDPPWRPADIEQREGRILRQGNQNESVQIFRYVTEGSFDAYMWQTLESKCRFIAQVMTGDATARKAEDIDAVALTYAEVKAIASGNPLVVEKAAVDAEVVRLTRLRKQHFETQGQIQYRLKNYQTTAREQTEAVAAFKSDLAARQPTAGNQFAIKIEKELTRDRGLAGERLIRLAKRLPPGGVFDRCGSFAGFAFSLERIDSTCLVRIHGQQRYSARIYVSSAVGTISSLEETLAGMEKGLAEAQEQLGDCVRRAADLRKYAGQPFEYQQKLEEALARQQEIFTALDLAKNQAGALAEQQQENREDSVKVSGNKQSVSISVC